jgi:hypothetical protein
VLGGRGGVVRTIRGESLDWRAVSSGSTSLGGATVTIGRTVAGLERVGVAVARACAARHSVWVAV